MQQVCVRCGKEKTAAAFNRNKVRPDGLCSYCKVCNAAAAAERRKTRKPVLQPTVTHKVLFFVAIYICIYIYVYIYIYIYLCFPLALQPLLSHVSTCSYRKVCNAAATAECQKDTQASLYCNRQSHTRCSSFTEDVRSAHMKKTSLFIAGTSISFFPRKYVQLL